MRSSLDPKRDPTPLPVLAKQSYLDALARAAGTLARQPALRERGESAPLDEEPLEPRGATR